MQKYQLREYMKLEETSRGPSPTARWKEGRSSSPASRVLPDNITQKIRLNLFCEMMMFLIDTIYFSMLCLALRGSA